MKFFGHVCCGNAEGLGVSESGGCAKEKSKKGFEHGVLSLKLFQSITITRVEKWQALGGVSNLLFRQQPSFSLTQSTHASIRPLWWARRACQYGLARDLLGLTATTLALVGLVWGVLALVRPSHEFEILVGW